MRNSGLTRRRLIYGSLVFGGNVPAAPIAGNCCNDIAADPTADARSFYPLELPAGCRQRLIHVAGHRERLRAASRGSPGAFSTNGRLFPACGSRFGNATRTAATTMSGMAGPISLATRISRDTGPRSTDPTGGYQFLTIRPVPYPGRTPHIHFAVSGRGFERFITQMYMAGEPGNDGDPVLMGVRDPAARARLIVALRPSPDVGPDGMSGVFDIVLG